MKTFRFLALCQRNGYVSIIITHSLFAFLFRAKVKAFLNLKNVVARRKTRRNDETPKASNTKPKTLKVTKPIVFCANLLSSAFVYLSLIDRKSTAIWVCAALNERDIQNSKTHE